MIKIERATEFIQKHQHQVVDLFVTYQMIEMMLFLNLHLPGMSEIEDREDYLEEINKQLNSKTFGKLKKVYLEKYPKDEYQLISGMEIVAAQRNSFMHSFCMVLALWENQKEMNMWGKFLLDDFTKQANSLFDKIIKVPK
jgi:hypothetical protein